MMGQPRKILFLVKSQKNLNENILHTKKKSKKKQIKKTTKNLNSLWLQCVSDNAKVI